jgi:hypothetical protein
MHIFLGILLGTIITGLISYFFYYTAGKKLIKEAAELKQINRMVIQTFQLNGFEIAKDNNGNQEGIKVTLSAKLNN